MLINLVVGLVVLGIVLWLINAYVPRDGRIKQLVNVVVVVGAVLWVLQAFGLSTKIYAFDSASTPRIGIATVVR